MRVMKKLVRLDSSKPMTIYPLNSAHPELVEGLLIPRQEPRTLRQALKKQLLSPVLSPLVGES
jgi:hypothetical protein